MEEERSKSKPQHISVSVVEMLTPRIHQTVIQAVFEMIHVLSVVIGLNKQVSHFPLGWTKGGPVSKQVSILSVSPDVLSPECDF